MPLYEFECLDCGAEFEKLVIKLSGKDEVKCPECGSRKLEEKLSTFASGGNCSPDNGGG